MAQTIEARVKTDSFQPGQQCSFSPHPGEGTGERGAVVSFRQALCRLRLRRYPGNGRPALQLVNVRNDNLVVMATLNLSGINDRALHVFAERRGYDPDALVFIKDWAENEGLLAALLAAGVIEDTGATVPTGVVLDRGRANVCRLLVRDCQAGDADPSLPRRGSPPEKSENRQNGESL